MLNTVQLHYESMDHRRQDNIVYRYYCLQKEILMHLL